MKPTSGTRKPYTGQSRSLVLAVDIGTTFSGVSYAILEPGEVPKIHGVTRFPGQEHVAGNSKVPTIMYYDSHGRMMAAGAEAESASTVAQAEDEGWVKAELFKLRLRPKNMKLKMNGMRFAPLPSGKTAVDVFADFLAYLFNCTRSFIVDTHANGPALWHAVEQNIEFVLSHPNGWEGAQQTKMRRAAVYGGLIPDTDEGKARIRFVTEGEASLHACVLNGLAADVLQNPSGHGFIVADAGGGTLDISSYAIRGTSPLVIEEIAPPDCVFAGSVFVSRRARAFFEEKLRSSKYGTPDSLDHITKRFDETTKRLFRDRKELQFVPFGSPLDKDPTVGIRGGQLKLTGAEVAALFEPSVEAAVQSIKAQIDASGGAVKSVWLVGGFAASPWLFSQLQERLAPYHVTVSRPDSQTSKAVADGAIGFYCDHHVSARMSKFMYGVEYLREFDPKDEEHAARKHRLFELPSGPKLLPDAFDCILNRGVRVKESTVFSRKYCTEVTNLSTLSVFEVEIWCYRGGGSVPKWILRNADNFSTLCYVRADLSPLAGSAQSKQGRNGKTYWTIVFNIEIHFGLTEFRARIKWLDNGKTRYGPASIVYNESGHRAEEDEPDESPEDNVTILSTQSDRSRQPSRVPSREPSQAAPSSRVSYAPRSPSVETARPELSRSSTTRSAMRSETRTPVDKGKQREIIPETPRPQTLDRSVNVSGRSADSGRSGQLAEALSSVWGSASKYQSPAVSRVESSRSTVPTMTREELSPITPREASKVATPWEVVSKPTTPKEASKAATPREATVPPTPREVSRIPSLKEATAPPIPKELTAPSTPKEPSKAPTPRESKLPTPREVSKAPTPKEVSKAPTPEVSKAPTPKEVSKAPTPKETSKAPTPKEQSVAPTPKTVSKAPTPKAVSKAPTPKETSKAPTPKATTPKASKAPTPQSTSKVATPRADPEPLPAEPASSLVDAVSSLWPPAHDDTVVPPPPVWDMPPTMPDGTPSVAATEKKDAPKTGASTPFTGWFPENETSATKEPESAGFSDLVGSPGHPKPGGFSSFLSGGSWGAKPSSNAGGFGGFGGIGSTLWGSGADPAKEQEEKRRQEEERKAQEEAAKQAAEVAAAAQKAEEEAAQRRAEEEAAQRAEEEAAQRAEEEAAQRAEEARRKTEEEEAARKAEDEAKAKADEEEAARKKAVEEEAARKQAEEAESEAARQKADEEEAARKAEEEKAAAETAGASKNAEEDAEATKKAEDDAEATRKAEEEAKRKEEEEEEAKKKADEDEWAIPVKKGKKKKGKKGAKDEDEAPPTAASTAAPTAAATPEAVSRTTSAAAPPDPKNAKKTAKNKKNKKKGKNAGGDDDDDNNETTPAPPAADGGWGNSNAWGGGEDDGGGWEQT